MEFRTSEQIGDVAAALAAAQGELPIVEKNKTGKVSGVSKSGAKYEYSYKYADIADVYAAALPVLSKHGLCVVQPTIVESGSIFIRTRLIHGASGQWLESDYPVCSISGDHQKMGGALTYARRYAGCSLIGIVAEDDVDGEIPIDGAKKETRQIERQERPKPQEQRPPNGQQPLPPRVQNGNQQPTESKRNARDTYAALQADMRTNETAADLRAWWNDNDCIELRHSLPDDWQKNLHQQFVDLGQELTSAEQPVDVE